MCTVGLVMGIQAAGTLTSAYGSYSQGLAQAAQYKYAASNSRKEAELAIREGDTSARLAADQGAEELKRLVSSQKTLEGQQRAVIGANMGGGSKTAADIIGDTFDKEKMDQLAVEYNANLASYKAREDAKLRAYSLGQEAEGYDIAATGAKSAGKFGAFNDLLTGAGQVAQTAYLGKLSEPNKKTFVPRMNKKLSVPGYPY